MNGISPVSSDEKHCKEIAKKIAQHERVQSLPQVLLPSAFGEQDDALFNGRNDQESFKETDEVRDDRLSLTTS